MSRAPLRLFRAESLIFQALKIHTPFLIVILFTDRLSFIKIREKLYDRNERALTQMSLYKCQEVISSGVKLICKK